MASDVRSLMEEIETNYLAAKRALSAPAIVASHAFIQKRMEEMGDRFEQLKDLVGEETALKLTVNAMSLGETKYELEQENAGISK